jgi:hypothetical protein
MSKTALAREKWTLTFDGELKRLLTRAARKRGIYPVRLLEELVREHFNPYGHTDVEDSARYVAALRKRSRAQSDQAYLDEIRAWQRSRSS